MDVDHVCQLTTTGQDEYEKRSQSTPGGFRVAIYYGCMAGEPALVKCPNCGKMNRVRPAASGVPHCGNCEATLPWLTESGEADFPTVVEQSSLPVLVDFWAPWCGPCRIVSPIVEKIATELPGRLKLVKVNSDNAPDLSRRFGIRGIPTLVLMNHGKEVARVTGALPAPALRSWVDQHLPKGAGNP